MMSETIKAKTSQRLRRRSDCPLRVSLSALRNTIVPLLLLLVVIAGASYPSLLPLKPLYAPIVEILSKKNKKRYSMELQSFFLLLEHLSKGSWPPNVRPLVRALVAPQGAPLMRLLRTALSLMPRASICRVLICEHDAYRT
jgi:hypothetical protein